MNNEQRISRNKERLSGLVPKLRGAILYSFHSLEAAGYFPYIIQGYRTQEQQNAYWAQGREDLQTVNNLRRIAGLDPINDAENAKHVTWVTHSKHMDGLAVDIANVKDGDVDWDNMVFYRAAATEFAKYGLVWGGSWKDKQDNPHFEV